MESFLEAWDLICDYCKKQVTDVSYETWFSKLVPISLDFGAGVAIIQAPNEFNKSTIERGFHKCLNDAVQSVFGEAFTYKLITPMEKKEKERVPDDDEYEYTFETFIEGSSNKFDCAACRYVAKEPAKNYNPLFIYGNSGLGKTHLLNAIGHELKKNFPDKDIIYVKGDQFANELIEAIRAGTTVSFREKYRKAAALLIDDIQFIAGKESTQEPPDFETRMAIIKRKAELVGLSVPDNVCEFIAQKLKSNIRQLEGTVKKLNAIHLVEGATPTISTAQRAISDIVNNEQPAPVTVSKIIEEVGRTYGVSPEDIKSSKRNANVSFARQISMYVVREITQMPMVEIGKEFGGRDHSTVVYAIQQIEEKSARDPVTKATVSDIIKNIRDR